VNLFAMDLYTRAEVAIALADGVRKPATVPADTMARKRQEAATMAATLGFAPDRLDAVAEEAETTLCAFADALHAAADAARNVIAMRDKHAEEMRKNDAHTD
jgi:diacylglycerol kinase family enzyme